MTFDSPLVTIVTPCFNSARFLEETIQSVLSQKHHPIEHIVIDGGSTDGTLDILKKYDNHLTWISEADSGQTEAINKGFRRASGSILSWLNADDLLMPGAIEIVVDHFQKFPDSHFIYGDAIAIDENGHSYGLRLNIRPCTHASLISEGDFIVQPAAFWRAQLWAAIGELDQRWHYVMDYDYWIRASKHYALTYIPHTLAQERLYSAAKTFSGSLGRVIELETMPQQHGGEGVPRAFRPEAAVGYLSCALVRARHGSWAEAKAYFQKAWKVGPSVFRVWLYLITAILFGESNIVRFRLVANRLRNQFPILKSLP